MSESKKAAGGVDIRSFFGGGTFAKKKADDAAAAKTATAAAAADEKPKAKASGASAKKDKAKEPKEPKEPKAAKPAAKKPTASSSSGKKKNGAAAVVDDDDEVMEVDADGRSQKAKSAAAAPSASASKAKSDIKASPEAAGEVKSPHFAKATADTEAAPKAGKSGKAKKRILEDDEEEEGEAAAAAAAAAASGSSVTASPAKPVVVVHVDRSTAKPSRAKENVAASDFFAAAAAPVPVQHNDAESKARMAARVAEHAKRKELEAQAAAIEASIAEAKAAAAREQAEQEAAIAAVQKAEAEAAAPMEDVAAQPTAAAAVVAAPDAASKEEDDEDVAEIPKPVASPARGAAVAPKSPARSPARSPAPAAKSPLPASSADAATPSSTSTLSVPLAAASTPATTAAAATAASPRKSPAPSAPSVSAAAAAKPAAPAPAPAPAPAVIVAAPKPAVPVPAPVSASKKNVLDLSDDIDDEDAAMGDFGGGGAGAGASVAYDAFADVDDDDRVKPSPLKKGKLEGGEAAPKKWKYGQQPAGPSAPGSKEIPLGKPNCLAGLTFVLSGSGESLSREDATDLLKKYGARVTTSISKKTDYLIEGAEAGESKLSKARELKTKIINEDAMLQLIRDKSKGWTPPPGTGPAASAGMGAAPAAAAAAAAAASAVQIAPPGAALPKPVAAVPIAARGSAHEQSILRCGLQTASSVSDMLWVDAHRPLSVSGIIGNPGTVKQIADWLESWHDKRKHRERNMDPKLAAKVPKALLISGPPGIGKSTAATVIAKSKGFEVIEFNASDVRNKKSLEAVVGDITGNRGLGEFFAKAPANNNAAASSSSSASGLRPAGKTVIIMDEVDGMGGNEDRGGMQELVALIKSTRTPIICIANDASSPKMKTLKNYVESLTWRRVPSAQIAPRILEICKKEGLSIDRQSVEKIAESTHGDIRQILNFLQLFRKTNTAVGFDQVKQRMDTAGKDFDLGAFDVVPELFKPVPPAIPGSKGADWISERQNRYFVDSDIIPLFVAENYLHAKPHIQAALLSRSNDKLKRMAGAQSGAVADVLGLEVIAEAADSISCGDLLSDAMYSEQDYTLMPSHAILSTVYPAYLMRGGLSERLHFPALLGKQSTRNKNLRIAREFKTALSIDIHADSEEMAMFVMPQLRIELLQALQNDDDAGVEAVIEQLDRFGLDKDEFDLLMEWGEKFIRDESMHFQSLVPSGAKMKLTRTWKQGSHLRKVSRGAKKDGGDVSKGRGAAFKDVLDDDGEDEEENEDDEEEEEDPLKAAAAVAKGVKGAAAAKKGAAAAASSAKKPAAPKKPRAPAKPKAAKPAAAKKRAAPSSDDDDDF